MGLSDAALMVQGGELATMAAERNPAALYLLALQSRGSRYTMARKLDKVAALIMPGNDPPTRWQMVPWEQLQPVHFAAILAKLAEEYSPAYVNAIRAAVRGVMDQAHDLEQIDDRTARLIRKVARIHGSEELAGRYVPAGERDKIMAACTADEADAGLRDAAIIACGYPGGLRRAEIAALQREDVTDEGAQVVLHVTGKGRKRRPVPLDNGGADALRGWLAFRGDAPGPLFWRGKRGGRGRLEPGKGITPQAVYYILKRRAVQAGTRAMMPHDLRRSTASDMLDRTDTVTTAKYLGHSNESTTGKYDRRGERALSKAAEALQIAYTPRKR